MTETVKRVVRPFVSAGIFGGIGALISLAMSAAGST